MAVIYKTIDLETGNYYIGVDSKNDSKYLGSGTNIKNIIKSRKILGLKFPYNLRKDILYYFDSAEDAFKKEKEIVTEEFIKNPNVLNLQIGGAGINLLNRVTVKDAFGNTLQVRIDDERYLNKTLIPINSGQVTVQDKDGNNSQVSVYDERYISGELKSIFAINNITVKDKVGFVYRISKDDERYNNANIVGVAKDMVSVKDKDGNTSQVRIDDPRYLNGELIPINVGKVIVKDLFNNILSVSVDDERYLNGELVGISKDMVSVKDKDGNTFQISKEDPRWSSGELVGVSKGKKWISNYNDKINKCVDINLLEEYLNNGWQLGRYK